MFAGIIENQLENGLIFALVMLLLILLKLRCYALSLLLKELGAL